MADISVRDGYTAVAPAVREAIPHPNEALSEQLFSYLALTGAIAGGAFSFTLDSVYPAATGILCTMLGCAIGVMSWYLGHTVWQTSHPRHD